MLIPFHRPAIPPEEKLRPLVEIALSGLWTRGIYTEKYESALRAYLGGSVYVVNSGSSALELLFKAVPLPPKSKIALPVWSYCATAAAVCHAGHIPLFVDIEPQTLNLSVEALEVLAWDAVMPIHFAGMAADLEALTEIARSRGKILLEDASHGMGGTFRDVPLGTWGMASAFSTHATKPLATGQGGFVWTADKTLAEKINTLRQNGIQRSMEVPWHYEVTHMGHNYQISEWQAYIGLWQMENLFLHQRRRQEIALYYTQRLAGAGPWQLPEVLPYRQSTWHLYVLRWQGRKLSRDEVMDQLRARGIECSLHWPPLHRQPAFRAYLQKGQTFPHADKAFTQVISLPIYPSLTDAEVEYIVDSLRSIAARNKKGRR
ncbi:MAG: DegT/DnrJ/EryC1/StrS family aminotransferase [Bacteroidia bacterium]